MIGKRSYESLIMMPRLHPETNENQHKRFAQHIGSPRRGAPGRRRHLKKIYPQVLKKIIVQSLVLRFQSKEV
jgi:hypothetical protein